MKTVFYEFAAYLNLRFLMSQEHQDVKTGTTTVGIVFDGGVILATERRVTMGNLIASKKAKKVQDSA